MKFKQGTNPGKVWDGSINKIGVIFVDGVFETDDAHLIALLNRAGYAGVEVMSVSEDSVIEPETVDSITLIDPVNEPVDFEKLAVETVQKRTKKATKKQKMVRKKG